MKRIIPLFLALISSSPVYSQTIPDLGEYRDPRGRAEVDPNIFKENSCRIVAGGQSPLANYGWFATPYHPWTGSGAADEGVFEFDKYSGKIYKVTSGSFPTFGMDGYYNGEVLAPNPPSPRLSPMPYIADLIVATGRCKRALIAGDAIGGTTVFRWTPVGDLFQRSQFLLNKLTALGIPPNIWIDDIGFSDINPNNANAADNEATLAAYMKWKWIGLGIWNKQGVAIVVVQGARWLGFSDVYPARAAMVKNGKFMSTWGATNVTGTFDLDAYPGGGVDGDVHPSDGMRYWMGQAILPLIPNF